MLIAGLVIIIAMTKTTMLVASGMEGIAVETTLTVGITSAPPVNALTQISKRRNQNVMTFGRQRNVREGKAKGNATKRRFRKTVSSPVSYVNKEINPVNATSTNYSL